LNNPLKYVDPTGYYGETLGEPHNENGSLGYTAKEGYLISIDGKWYPVESNSVDILTRGFTESIRNDEVSNWSDFIDDYIPDMPENPETDLGYGWGGGKSISLGGRDYYWSSDLFGDYDRETGSRITRLVLDDTSPVDWSNIDWGDVGRQFLGAVTVVGGAVVISVGGGIMIAAWTPNPVTLASGQILGRAFGGFIVSIGGFMINWGCEISTPEPDIGPFPPVGVP
jgi:hypothetical protein